MDRNLFFVFTNYIVLKLLNACISIHVPAYSRFPPWRLEMVSKLSLSYGRKIHCWNTHYLKQVNVLNIFGLKHERFTLISFKNDIDINLPYGCFDSYWFFTLMPRDVHRSTVWSFGAQVPHRMPRHFRSKNLLHDVEQSFIAP